MERKGMRAIVIVTSSADISHEAVHIAKVDEEPTSWLFSRAHHFSSEIQQGQTTRSSRQMTIVSSASREYSNVFPPGILLSNANGHFPIQRLFRSLYHPRSGPDCQLSPFASSHIRKRGFYLNLLNFT
jgi:hypothetical protein